jgi:hypothetical protein
MTRKRLFLGAITLAAIIASPIAWYLISPLFITRTVNEDFPGVQAIPAMQDKMTEARPDDAMLMEPSATMVATLPNALAKTSEAMPPYAANAPQTKTAQSIPPASDGAMMVATSKAIAAKPDDGMLAQTPEAVIQPTAAPSNEPRLLRTGEFHPVTHEGQGSASIYELPDGRRVLRLENFEVLNGPDLYVWLSSAPDADNAQTILNSNYVSLGRLKGNKGNQNYELPADLDVSRYNLVTIWCRQFSVNFATAPLK